MNEHVTAVGVDGWKDGWVAAHVEDGRVHWRAYEQGVTGPRTAFGRLLGDFPDAVVAVDIPIGTVERQRDSDAAAREFLRAAGASPSSVFATPSAATVGAHRRRLTHLQAMEEARAAGLPGTSIQAWHLIPKMLEVQAALGERSVREAHPECSFRALDTRVGSAQKKTGLGVGVRLRALRRTFDLDLADAPARVPVDDLLDAAAVLWTATRICDGTFTTLPADPRPGEPVIHV